MIWDPSTLAKLSAPGFNRPIGAGDVVPYWGNMPDMGGVSGSSEAQQGPRFDPNDIAGTGPTGPPAAPTSILNNLSTLTPIVNQLVQQQQQGAEKSGQAPATAQPLPAAVSGWYRAPEQAPDHIFWGSPGQPGGWQEAPGSKGDQMVLWGNQPSPAGTTAAGSQTIASTSSAPSGGSADSAPGAAPAGDAGAASAGAASSAGSAGPTGPGSSSAGVAGAADNGGVAGPAGDAGGGGGGAGDGGSVLVTYTLRHLPENGRRALAFWTRIRRSYLQTQGGQSVYDYYQRTGRRLIAAIEKLSDLEKQIIRQELHTILVAPFTRRATPADLARAPQHLLLVCAGLHRRLNIPVEA